jgi:hypothetical protein
MPLDGSDGTCRETKDPDMCKQSYRRSGQFEGDLTPPNPASRSIPQANELARGDDAIHFASGSSRRCMG